ncbi:MAG TPA: hypothetical protein VGD78_20935 [Chthoniobacterales bacterium]
MTLKAFCEHVLATESPRLLYAANGDHFTPVEFLTEEAYAHELTLEVKVEGDHLTTFNRKGEPLVGSELYFKRPEQPEEETEER